MICSRTGGTSTTCRRSRATTKVSFSGAWQLTQTAGRCSTTVSGSATKCSVVNWTQSHALMLAPFGINVNAICPGLVWTPMFEQMFWRLKGQKTDRSATLDAERAQFDEMIQAQIPMKREQTPEDIGRLAAFLASDDSRNITGQAINVDGGRRMN